MIVQQIAINNKLWLKTVLQSAVLSTVNEIQELSRQTKILPQRLLDFSASTLGTALTDS